ncbi:hypothetical protein DCS_04919 [Drechmeria coniospora]|uniref:Peptidase A1 domain-containing protein n=1 Tax=Drechmeria coniospora TaxID=98403 RepID=A0A151GLD9_DRECN|nr:hypothetical protein DCS_04919 [Drechmeria coniospora]KYK57906.1 hypothetical protein DCS_04919 [Drechmeria coniospora]
MAPLQRFALLVFLALLSLAEAGILSLSVSRRGPDSTSLLRRDGTLNLTTRYTWGTEGYYVNMGVGEPVQNLHFLLHTTTSLSWVLSAPAYGCKEIPGLGLGWCQQTFNPEKSSTFSLVDQDALKLGEEARTPRFRGFYFNDTVTIQGKQIKNQHLGLAFKNSRFESVIGLGLQASDASKENNATTIIDSMVENGIIDVPVFSLYLNGADAESGTILFGGVDSKKYHGTLATIPLMPDPKSHLAGGDVTSYAIHLRGLEVDGLQLDPLDTHAIMDASDSRTVLPREHVTKIYKHFGVYMNDSYYMALIDCAYGREKGKAISFRFNFSGQSIVVPMREMIFDAKDGPIHRSFGDEELNKVADGWESICYFGIVPPSRNDDQSAQTVYLGDSFLRSSYVVFDQANLQIGLAQAIENATESNIIKMKKGEKKFPDAVAAEAKARILGPSVNTVTCLLITAAALLAFVL